MSRSFVEDTATVASMTFPPATSRHRLRMRSIVLRFAGALLVLWAVASGYFIVFHDSMITGLLRRQAEMQYAYEDRIAELRIALEGASAQTIRDSQAQDGALRDLAVLGAKLEARADTLAALIGTSRTGDLHLRMAPETGQHTGLGTGEIAAKFAALEARQRAIVDELRKTTEHTNIRTQAALSELGLAPMTRAGTAAGGPFVPIAESKLTPEDNLALLTDAFARHRQLEAITGRLPLRQPVGGRLDVTSGFGARRDPFYGRLALHTGIDLREDYGSAVCAVAAGMVTIAGSESGYGTLVEIDHGNGYATRYAHLSAVSVAVGQKVGVGALIGRVGTTGRSTGPHLHYEVRIAGEPVDPARYLTLAAEIAGE